ncbi:n-acetylglutamate synthase [Emticicia sp. TH156]|uniref:n-acetylglutamate synthase n=1 Tax=Emticicia sp. TH156 TaxID=2067454 RepID=UPI000C78EC97|nr:n-acetylglutamate synthase [Emticicia sp. TH156]PLK45601.1 n-acetylglutamate synthase [Emticicia sp. TH156]
MLNLHKKTFRAVRNAANGDVGDETLFHYSQEADVVWAEYAGGTVVKGFLIAKMLKNSVLDMRYEHLNTAGELMTGKCISTPEILPDGRIRLHEKWQWTSRDLSSGESVVEEIIG